MLNTNLTLNLKTFQEVLPHLHGNYKEDFEEECDSNLGKSVTYKILEGGNLHTNESNSTKQEFVVLQCYRQSYVNDVKNIETGQAN